jgi:hypothetical protein
MAIVLFTDFGSNDLYVGQIEAVLDRYAPGVRVIDPSPAVARQTARVWDQLAPPIPFSAAGRVTYVGTGISGLGKLVVIKHDNGFITVYAHNKDIMVKEQQAVARGQKIAELGNTDADRPKLHFQIRKGSAAVDPMRYLPAS